MPFIDRANEKRTGAPLPALPIERTGRLGSNCGFASLIHSHPLESGLALENRD